MKCKDCGLEWTSSNTYLVNNGTMKHLCEKALAEELNKMKNMRDLLSNKLQEKIKENELLKAWKYNVRHTVLGE